MPTSVSPLNVGDSGLLTWRTLDVLPDNARARAIVDGPAGWLLLAPRNDQINGWIDAVVLRSDDAVTWEEYQTTGFEAVVHVSGVVGNEAQYLAYGLYASPGYTVITLDEPSNFAEPAVWVSLDGVDWELTPLPLPAAEETISDNVSYWIAAVAADGENVVAVGIEFDENLPEVYNEEVGGYEVSTRQVLWQKNGSEPWEVVDAPELGTVSEAAAGPGGLIAAVPDESGSAVWRWDSADTQWDQVSDLPGSVGGLVANAMGYLALTDGQMWYSTDAIQWEPVGGSISASFIEAGQGGFVAATGRAAGQLETGVWWSPDAQRWRKVGSTDQLSRTAFLAVSLAAIDQAAVVIVTTDPTFQSAMLIGTAP